MRIIQKCKNGDTDYTLFDNGTRILDNHKNAPFNLEWPVSIDLNISNYCERGCPFCYQNCTREGKSADLNKIKSLLHPFMEVAINFNMGYNIDTSVIDFLEYCRKNNIIVNATINQDDLLTRKEEIMELQDRDLIHGLGISVTSITPDYLPNFDGLKNVVFHVIAGLINPEYLEILLSKSVLILGYKQKGRAEHNDVPNMTNLKQWLTENLDNTVGTLCFDNLAIKQLGIKDMIPDYVWQECYQGDEGTISMYINGVDLTFAVNSFTDKTHPIGDYNIEEMFNIVRKEGKK